MIKYFLYSSLLLTFISCSYSVSEEIVIEQTDVEELPFFNEQDFTPEWISKNEPKYDSIHTVSEFSLTNQNGQTVNNSTFEGKIYVADFFFTVCPGICPKLTSHMGKIQEEFKNDNEVLLLSHSVMPTTDSVSVLKKYAEKNNVISSKWHLVTGTEKEIYDLARFSYFADENFKTSQDEEAFVHTENFLLIDKHGRIRGVYNGTLEFDVNRLIKHIKILQQEE